MTSFITPELDSEKDALVRRVSDGDATFGDLVAACPDPAEAFVISPVRIELRKLARMYAEEADEEDRHRVLPELRRRCSEERWMERRAMFQARRHATRQDAILEAEASIWAVLGLEFAQHRIRSLFERYEKLDAYVQDSLERLENQEGSFTTNLRDAMKELRDVEERLSDIMPKLGVSDRAMQVWTKKAGSREDLVRRAASALESVEGNDQASNVFNLLDYVEGVEDGGGG